MKDDGRACNYQYLQDHYPPSGGDGSGDSPCDDWPHVPAAKVKDQDDCRCPPDKGKYAAAKAAAFLNIIPMVGEVAISAIGIPADCSKYFQKAADAYQSAQKEFVAMCSAMEREFEQVVDVMREIFSEDTGGQPKGILPDTIRAALAPGMHITLYLALVSGAVLLVLVGVVFTM
jgi:hypothetical protein